MMTKKTSAVVKRSSPPPRPLRKRHAVILTRIHSEHSTLSAAKKAADKVKLAEDEWAVVITK